MSKVKNRIRPGNILVSDTERAIIIEYEQEAFELNDDGSTGQSLGKSPGTKKLKVKTMTAETDVDVLAADMMEKCKLIKTSALPVLKAALKELQLRQAPATAVDSQTSKESSLAATEKIPDPITIASSGKVLHKSSSGDSAQREPGKSKKSRREKISSVTHCPDASPRTSQGTVGDNMSLSLCFSGESKAAKRTALEEERRQRSEQSRKYQEQLFASQDRRYGSAELASLDTYMEQLYEDDQVRTLAWPQSR